MLKNLFKKINMPPKNFSNLMIGTLLFLTFLVLTIVESFNILNPFDPKITQFFQTVIARTWDVPLSYFSLIGSPEITTVILLLTFYYLYRQQKVFLFSLGLFGVILALEIGSKFFIYHPGPPKIYFRYALPFSPPNYLTNAYSYPSGHVSRTVFLVVVLGTIALKNIAQTFLRRIIVLTLIGIAIFMIVSRVYLGEHWASDVIGGLLLGGAMGFLAMVYY